MCTCCSASTAPGRPPCCASSPACWSRPRGSCSPAAGRAPRARSGRRSGSCRRPGWASTRTSRHARTSRSSRACTGPAGGLACGRADAVLGIRRDCVGPAVLQVRRFSAGDGEALSFARALLGRPRGLLIDEATRSSTPRRAGAARGRDRAARAPAPRCCGRRRGATSSEGFCDRVAVLQDGRVRFEGDLTTLAAYVRGIHYMLRIGRRRRRTASCSTTRSKTSPRSRARRRRSSHVGSRCAQGYVGRRRIGARRGRSAA